jgi:predicted small secreted protein
MKTLIGLVIAGFLLAGCNTIEGMGKDIKKGGEVIEKAAEKAKP